MILWTPSCHLSQWFGDNNKVSCHFARRYILPNNAKYIHTYKQTSNILQVIEQWFESGSKLIPIAHTGKTNMRAMLCKTRHGQGATCNKCETMMASSSKNRLLHQEKIPALHPLRMLRCQYPLSSRHWYDHMSQTLTTRGEDTWELMGRWWHSEKQF